MTCRRISLDAPTFKMFKICGAAHVTAILSECFYNFPICVSNSNRRGLLYRHILGPTSGEFPGPNPGKFGLYRLGFGPGMGTFIWHQKPHNHSRFCCRIPTTDWKTLFYSQHCYYSQKSSYLIFEAKNKLFEYQDKHTCVKLMSAFSLCDNTGHKRVKGCLGTDYTVCLDSPTTERVADIMLDINFQLALHSCLRLRGAAVFSCTAVLYVMKKVKSIIFI